MRYLVIGGSKGIGYEIAKELSKEHHVCATFNQSESLVNEKINYFKLDLGDNSSVRYFLDDINFEFDAVVFNAGVNRRGDFLDMTEDDYDFIMDINLKSYVFLIQSMERRGILKNGMRLIFVSSVASQYYGPTTCHYMLSKVGINALVKFLAQRYSGNHILVNAIAPGLILTDQTSTEFSSGAATNLIGRSLLKHPVSVASVLSAIRYLLDPNNNDLTGHVLPISGGAIL
jgi:3-oxoacyl-[acyl-carrier protein] reductase